MNNYLKVSEAPKTKLQLKKAIQNDSIIVFEKDMNDDKEYTKIKNFSMIFKLWEGFVYSTKYKSETEDAKACLGTSFYYKFKKS